jgi:hypothetical protein
VCECWLWVWVLAVGVGAGCGCWLWVWVLAVGAGCGCWLWVLVVGVGAGVGAGCGCWLWVLVVVLALEEWNWQEPSCCRWGPCRCRVGAVHAQSQPAKPVAAQRQRRSSAFVLLTWHVEVLAC